MANTLRFKRGLASGLPAGVAGEPLFTTDTFDLYIGTGAANQRYQKYIASGTTLQYLRGDGSLATFPTNIITGTGVAGQVAYFTGANTQVGDNGLTWDSVNKRLSINTSGQGRTITTFYGAGSIGQNIFIGGGGLNSGIGGGPANFGSYNTSLGVNALLNNTTGEQNSAFGVSALSANTTGYQNVANGYLSLNANTNGAINTSIGVLALLSNTSGNNNTSLGYSAGYGVGTNANTTGSNNIFIGSQSVGVSATESNRTWIGNSTTTSTWLAGNLLLGSTTNGTQRLQVTGDTLMKGSGNTSATSALTVQDSGGNAIFRVVNDGRITLTSSNFVGIIPTNAGANTPEIGGVSLRFITNTATAAQSNFYFRGVNGLSGTSGNQININAGELFSPTSGTATFSQIQLGGTINQTGGANGITRGLYVNPTLTAAADWRSIEWSNNTGWGLYGAGTANSFFNGSVGIGVNSLTGYNLRINKTITGSPYPFSLAVSGGVQSDVTALATYVHAISSTQATTFTLPQITLFNAEQGTFGAGSTVTYQVGFNAANLSGATTNVGFNGDLSSGTGKWNLYMGGTAANFLSGNTQIGTGAFTSEKLQVNGTMKVTGASTFGENITISKNQNAGTELIVSNTSNTTSAQSRVTITTNGGNGQIAKLSSVYTPYKILNSSDFYLYNATAGDISLLNDFATGSIKMAAGGSSTAHLTIASTGAATFSSTLTANGYTTISNTGGGTFNSQLSLVNTTSNAALVSFANTINSFAFGFNSTTTQRFVFLNSASTEIASITSTGAATFSSSITALSLIVDTTTFVVDATNNRVGVGTNVPTSSLHVVGSVTKSHTTKTANYTATESDYTILCNTTGGGFTITLPAASGCSGRIYVIKKTIGNSGVNNVTIDGNASETIDGSATIALQCRSSVMIQSDGSNWWILSQYADNSCI